MNFFKNKIGKWEVLIFLSVIFPFIVAVFRIIEGNISFWYDPARDFFLALSNHEKLSLIGQTSGIPGIFYGPYWIWGLSLLLFFFEDPRAIAFFALTLPYFTIFPYILYKFSKVWGIGISLMVWLFFALSYDSYFIHLWNPHPAPLLTLMVIFFTSKIAFEKTESRRFVYPLISGITAGLLLNFHISFGLSVLGGLLLYLLLKRNIRAIACFLAGVLLTLLPFLVFEIRHGFNQLEVLYKTVTSGSAVVSERSGTKLDIVINFMNSFSRLLSVPNTLGYIFLTGIFIFIVLNKYVEKIKPNEYEKKLLLIISSITLSLFIIYLSTKNPVWDYHFIGVEILFIIFTGFIASKSLIIRRMFFLILVLAIMAKSGKFIKELSANPYAHPSLVTKQHIVDTIYSDSQGLDFSVFTYSPTHFTPDFDYLLTWRGKARQMDNYKNETRENLIYLVIPMTTKDLIDDFIDNRTPNENYKTTHRWQIEDGTLILRRQLDEGK